MFSWFGKGRKASQAEQILLDAQKALNCLGELIEKHPSAYIDEQSLPLPKPEMKTALKILWIASNTDQNRQMVEMGWSCLSFFLPDVGKVPITPDLPQNVSPEEAVAKLGPYLKFAKQWEAEMLANKAEFAEFVKSQKAP